MENQTIVEALLLGLLEGLTEFIPVSSTGHILLAGHFLGFESTGKAFEVLIQLGAILAILTRLFRPAAGSIADRPAVATARTRRFVLGILIAFLPAAVIGALAHDFIKTVLFETPKLICIMLILGGFVLLWVDRWPLKPRYHDVMDFPLSLCLEDRPVPVPGDDPRHVALRRDHRRRAAAGRRQALGGGVLVLPRHADHGRRLRLRPLQEPRHAVGRRPAGHRHRLRRRLRHGGDRRALRCSTTCRATAIALFAWWRLVVGGVGLVALLDLGLERSGAPRPRRSRSSARTVMPIRNQLRKLSSGSGRAAGVP